MSFTGIPDTLRVNPASRADVSLGSSDPPTSPDRPENPVLSRLVLVRCDGPSLTEVGQPAHVLDGVGCDGCLVMSLRATGEPHEEDGGGDDETDDDDRYHAPRDVVGRRQERALRCRASDHVGTVSARHHAFVSRTARQPQGIEDGGALVGLTAGDPVQSFGEGECCCRFDIGEAGGGDGVGGVPQLAARV